MTKELAGLYIEKGDPRRALPKLQVLFKANPRDTEVLGLLARAFEALEQRPKAVSVYKELARILGENGELLAPEQVSPVVAFLCHRDCHITGQVLSVGGGSLEKNVSPNLVSALQYVKEIGGKILGIVGRDGGYTAQVADACVMVPTVNPQQVTPHSEAFQAVIWHLFVSHPKLKVAKTKWESAVSK